jgi:glycerol-3-phosphate acyltransferase PlsX
VAHSEVTVDLKPVALDAMGGDNAPEATVAGAVRAAAQYRLPVLLVGDREALERELKKHAPVPGGVEVVHARTTIGMDESPGPALLRKRDSSIVVATDLVRDGKAAGVVSAGNSGAVMGAAALRLGLLPGLERPAIAMVMPNQRDGVILLDVGATVDTKPEHLCDFARIGSVYAHCLLHIEHPRVGLLNIGTEESKGNAVVKQASPLIQEAGLNFVGYVEGQDLALGEVEVVVCDGFVGNAILKAVEGYGELFWSMARSALSGSLRGRIGGWLLRPALRRVASKFDYATYGGALLVGVNGICVIGHGRSSPEAVANAVRMAGELAEQQVLEQLTSALRRRSEAAAASASVEKQLSG